uniref:proline-rich protein 1-like n=1 Tax=Erigeron canadensis TaxID=72917 RepID=UPI001CB91FC4|nr:proline-rich protein 1-like [Erigeron canadensis]
MEAKAASFSLVLVLFSVIAVFVSADAGYGKSQLEPYMTPKGEHVAYPKANSPKVPTKPVNPKDYPKLPSKPVVPKKEQYEKNYPKLPTKPVVPKKEQYEKNYPKLPTKPVVPKKEGGYGKIDPKMPSKTPVLPKPGHEGYGKTYPKAPVPSLPKVPEHPKNIAVQGLIYCKYGAKLLPLQGATARVTCLAVHKNGYESAPFSFSSRPADKKGYFLAKIPTSKLVKDDLWEIVECKAFLEKSPWTSCNNPEDTNGGIKGAHLTFSRHLNSNGYCLSSVGPFIYNPGHESLPKEGY